MASAAVVDPRVPGVAARLRTAIGQGEGTPEFRGLLARLLARPGRVLAPGGAPKWPALVLETCQALGGDTCAALDAAVAVEFVAAAADVVDDLVDDEWDEAYGERGRALNASLALSCLAQRCAGWLAGNIGATRALRVAALLSEGLLAACAGEDLDLLFERETEVSEERALEMTRRKAGALVAMACQVGAAVATDETAVVELVGEFGTHVGVIAQLLNDLAGVEGGTAGRGTDLQRRKKTLPVAFALRCAREEGLPHVAAWYQGGPTSDADEERLAVTLRDLGALHYTWVVADAHRREALATVRRLVEATGREEVRGLRRLIPTLRARRAGAGGGGDTADALREDEDVLGNASVARSGGGVRGADRSGAPEP